MSLIKINRSPTREQLNTFGLIWLVFFGIAGFVALWKTGSTASAATIWSLAVAVPVCGRFSPAFMRMVYLGMSYAAFPIGLVASHVALALIYYLVITPTGVLMRLLGYDPMRRRFDPDAASYWRERPSADGSERYFRQF